MTGFSFRIATHFEADKQMVEIWEGGAFKAGIYATERGVRIVSKHGLETINELGSPPQSVRINIGEPKAKEPNKGEGKSG